MLDKWLPLVRPAMRSRCCVCGSGSRGTPLTACAGATLTALIRLTATVACSGAAGVGIILLCTLLILSLGPGVLLCIHVLVQRFLLRAQMENSAWALRTSHAGAIAACC